MQNILDKLLTLRFLLDAALPFIFWLLIYYVGYFLLRGLRRKDHRKDHWFYSWRYLVWFAYLLALYQPIRFFMPQLDESLRQFGNIFTRPLLGKNTNPSLLSLFLLLPLFFLSSRLAKACVALLNMYLVRSGNLTGRLYKSKIQALLTLARYALILIFFLFGINILGINISSLGVILGALGLGIGFGLQNIAANFVSGISLLFSGHVQHGDFIRTPKAFGTVDHIGLISTIVLTTKYENLVIPNQYLLNEIIENASYDNNRIIQLHLSLGVSYESDLEQVVELLRQVLLRNPYYPSKDFIPAPGSTNTRTGSTNPKEALNKGNAIWLKGFGASSIDFEVRMMVENIDVYLPANHWFYMEVWKIFKEHGVQIPFPQVDVHLHGAETDTQRSVTGFGLNV